MQLRAYMPMTARVDLNIDEVLALIEYHDKMANACPAERLELRAMNGKTFGENAQTRRDKARYYETLLNEVWPK